MYVPSYIIIYPSGSTVNPNVVPSNLGNQRQAVQSDDVTSVNNNGFQAIKVLQSKNSLVTSPPIRVKNRTLLPKGTALNQAVLLQGQVLHLQAVASDLSRMQHSQVYLPQGNHNGCMQTQTLQPQIVVAQRKGHQVTQSFQPQSIASRLNGLHYQMNMEYGVGMSNHLGIQSTMAGQNELQLPSVFQTQNFQLQGIISNQNGPQLSTVGSQSVLLSQTLPSQSFIFNQNALPFSSAFNGDMLYDQTVQPQGISLNQSGGFPQVNVHMHASVADTNNIIASPPKKDCQVERCKTCKKVFSTYSSLQRHQVVHTGARPYQCKVCGKSFSYKHYLPRHARIHRGEKRITCSLCSKKFYYKSNLISHMQCHTGEKSFECKACKKRFSRKTSLLLHLKLHSDEKPYKCEVCHKLFKVKSYLKQHKTIHDGEKSFKCELCHKTFYIKQALKVHIFAVHMRDKLHVCKFCNKSFKVRAYLSAHLRQHRKKSYKCKICNKSFAIKNLRAHKLICTDCECSICKLSFTENKLFKKLDSENRDEEESYACESCYIKVKNVPNTQPVLESNVVGIPPGNEENKICLNEIERKTHDDSYINLKSENNVILFDKTEPDIMDKYEDLIPEVIKEEHELNIGEENCPSKQSNDEGYFFDNFLRGYCKSDITVKKEEDSGCGDIYQNSETLFVIKCEDPLVLNI
ncbi:hypothetical protein SK128_006983 [Halocaridina rubra]|uniref:C2H2-type domain-containing protein n=1 Tax=Halocaridina rubra TaxID=373956 RepID=A0AAN8WJV2_HALRR